MTELHLYMIAGAAGAVFLGSAMFLLRGRSKGSAGQAGPRPAGASPPAPGPSQPPPSQPPPSQERAATAASKAVRPLGGDDPFTDDDDPEITVVRVQIDADFDLDDDDEDEVVDPTAKAVSIVADSGAEEEEPTRATAVILVSAAGQTDRGLARKRNEDRFLRLDSRGVYVVADGMGGYAGGNIASETAVETIAEAFESRSFEGRVRGDLPRRAKELAQAVQMANVAIYRRAKAEPHLQGMGTTVVATRFALRKDRVYIAHVGDSRCYRLRGDGIRQLTTDHTLGNLGLDGPHAGYLSRAVGVKPEVTIDVIAAKPQPGDIYLLCSDGLTKMVEDDEDIREVVHQHETNLDLAVQKLVDLANAKGGRDNVTVVLVAVRHPSDLADPD